MKNQQLQVRVLDLPDMPVVYVRHIGPYKGDEKLFADLFKKLMTWTGARGLLADADAKVLIVYHDNPEITEASNLRTSVCVTVPRNTPVDGDIGYMILPGGRYAFGRFELAADEYQMAWDALCGEWLPESGYQPDDRPSFELCLNDPAEHPQHKHVVDICIPVKPM